MTIMPRQRSYITYALRANRMSDLIPNRMVSVTTKNGQTQEVNHVWLDLDEWMIKNLSKENASIVIALFDEKEPDRSEEAFHKLVEFGMPTVNLSLL